MAKTYWFTSDALGSGDPKLGRLLVRNFIYALARGEQLPARIMLMNTGVRLACEGSPVLDDLRLLIEKGVAVKCCGTCLEYLGLKDCLAVGDVGDMVGSVAHIAGDSDVVTVA